MYLKLDLTLHSKPRLWGWKQENEEFKASPDGIKKGSKNKTKTQNRKRGPQVRVLHRVQGPGSESPGPLKKADRTLHTVTVALGRAWKSL